MSADEILELLQPLSDTPWRVLMRKPGRLTAIGGLAGGPASLSERIYELDGELVDDASGALLYRLDELDVAVSCTDFGGLMVHQVPDLDRFIVAVLRD